MYTSTMVSASSPSLVNTKLEQHESAPSPYKVSLVSLTKALSDKYMDFKSESVQSELEDSVYSELPVS